VGHSALTALTSGAGNTAVGYQSLSVCTDGKYNTALGYQALGSAMNVGDSSTAVGYQSLYSADPDANDAGSNTAVGKQSGYDITTGTGNTLVGSNTGNSGSNDLTTGDNNTFIGNEASGSAAGASTQIVLGTSVVGSGDSTLTFGNGSTDTTCTHGATTWSNPSDERIKKEIKDSSLGLSFINDLKPRTFKYRTKGELPENHTEYKKDSTDIWREDKTYHGFIAQEVKTAIDNAGDNVKDGFEGWRTNATNDFQRVGEGAFVGALIKAVQELSAKVKALEDA